MTTTTEVCELLSTNPTISVYRHGLLDENMNVLRVGCSELVSAPSGQITTIIYGDGAPDRLVNLYRGRGGPPGLEGGRGLVRFRSVRKGARSWFRSGIYSIFPLFFDVGPWSHGDRYPCAAPNLVWKPTVLPNAHSLTMAVLCTPCELKRLISPLHWLWESIAWSSRHLTNPRQIMYGQGSCYRQSEFICQAPVPKLALFYQGAWATRAVAANGDT
jgi:hypothetical protein